MRRLFWVSIGNQMKKDVHSPARLRVRPIPLVIATSLILAFLVFEAFVFMVQKEGRSALPPNFGNFPETRAMLEQQPDKKTFTFAVVGDTQSVGTFERIAHELRRTRLDFAVLLGDCSCDGTEEEHRFFRAECHREYALPFPVFYVAGNHDVSPEKFPIARFEQDYGPTIFSFEYQRCLFIVLRILPPPFSNEESINFLEQFHDADLDRYRYRFVFMHIPPRISRDFKARKFRESNQLVELFDQLGVDYVFAGDFHGYARVKFHNTNYIVTGGGGGHLDIAEVKQFHHALVIHVRKDVVSERIIPGSKANDIEDQLERLAIVAVWPWLAQNPLMACVLNGACLVAFVVMGRSLVRRARGRDTRDRSVHKLATP